MGSLLGHWSYLGDFLPSMNHELFSGFANTTSSFTTLSNTPSLLHTEDLPFLIAAAIVLFRVDILSTAVQHSTCGKILKEPHIIARALRQFPELKRTTIAR